MKRIIETGIITLIIAISSNSFADCICTDWIQKSGYCVDYIKQRIPAFPIPKDAVAIKSLDNEGVKNVKAGDVAIFNMGNYWHVAYVENVHSNDRGVETSIDVSEMNFGGQVSSVDFNEKWGLAELSEWKRAVCCGVTDKYGQVTTRKNIAISTVNQAWSPDSSVFQLLANLLRTK